MLVMISSYRAARSRSSSSTECTCPVKLVVCTVAAANHSGQGAGDAGRWVMEDNQRNCLYGHVASGLKGQVDKVDKCCIAS